jgi:prepilin-type N-terminal cleavage/methylation domain-containing protein
MRGRLTAVVWRDAAGDQGLTIVEVLVVAAIVAVVAGISVPVTAAAIDAGRARQAASFMATRFRLARQLAVNASVNVGIVFDLFGGEWTFRVCRDGSNDGVHRADIANGDDPCTDGPYRMSELFPGVDVAIDPTLRGPSGEAPNPDPVRFGRSDLASFSPSGTCTAGSLYLRSRGQVQYAVRLAGVTGRTRVLRYDAASQTWKDP